MSEPITNVEDAVRELGALPVPVGPKPLALPEEQMEALVAAGNRVVNNAMHEHLCMCAAWPKTCLSTGNYYMGAWDVSGLEDALPAVLALWEQMRGGELLRLRARVDEVERAYTFDTAELKRRIAELEAERHSTNEALDDAVQELRARQTPAMPKPGVTGPDACEGCGSVPEQWCPDCAACEQGCFGGFDGNSCTHANAKWGGAR